MKKLLLLLAVLVVWVPLALAQDTAPRPAISDYVLVPPQPAVMAIPFQTVPNPDKAPSYCKPCLWYSGDFDSSNSNANGLTDEKDLIVSQAAIYEEFTVPKGKTWKITAAFENTLSSVSILDPKQADWDFRKGVSSGSGGTDIKSGTSKATFTATGRSGFGLTEYTVFTKLTKPVSLKAGTYWMNVTPYCNNSGDSTCDSARYFESNVVDSPPPNQYGPKDVQNDAFLNSSYFGANYAPANNYGTFPEFSCGLVGTQK